MPAATPRLGRRRFVAGGLAAFGGLLLPAPGGAQTGAAPLAPTPAQTAGPFYPTALPADVDNDLVLVRGSLARAQGVATHIRGRILDLDGRPIADARIEIWQCDAHGRYLHRGSGGLRDAAFQGFGRTTAGDDGSYHFRTIRPAPYPGRTPHIHFAVSAPDGRELVTQMYVAGEPGNDDDFLYRRLGDRRDAVTVPLRPASGVEEGALAGDFDIVLA